MQKELWKLAVQGMKKRKRNSLLLFGVLVIAFSFAIVGLSLVESMNVSNREYRYDNYGTWHTAVFQGKEEDASVYAQEKDMETGILTCCGSLSTGAGIGTADSKLIEMGRIGLQQGHFPKETGEAAMEANVLSRLGYSYELGQDITLQVLMETEEEEGLPEETVMVEKTFTLCGVIRSYSNLWQSEGHTLPGVFVTNQAEKQLVEEGRKASERKLKEKETMYYFKTSGEQEETAEVIRNTAGDLNRSDKGKRETVNNTYAYQETEMAVYPFLYLGIIFVTAGIAVVCIYSVRIKKQIQQIALFRSIGITKKQLRLLIFYETICLALPAIIIGFFCGCAETWLALRFLSGMNERIIIKVPYPALGFLFFLLILEIVAVRTLVLQIALRQPLTGRMSLNGRKIRRHKKIHKVLYAAFSAVICTVSFFTVFQSIEVYEVKKSRQRMPDYRFYSVSWEDRKVSDQDLKEIQEIPGIRELHGWGGIQINMKFPDMETCELNKELQLNTSFLTKQEDEGIACSLYGIREEDWDYYLDFEKLSIDREAFRTGEEIVVLFSVNTYGEVAVNGKNYKDVGIKKGDEIQCDIYGSPFEKDSAGNVSPAAKTEKMFTFQTRVGEVLKIVDEEITNPLQFFATAPYTVLCSSDALSGILGKLPEGNCVFPYETGKEFGYSQGEMYASENAGFLSTDVIAADIFGKNHVPVESVREENTVIRQDLQNKLILYAAGGGTVIFITFLMLWNMLSLSAEDEKRKTGILMAIGLSEKQVRKRILTEALTLGAVSVLAGFLLFGGYLYLYSWLELHSEMILYQETGRTIQEILMTRIEGYRVAGIRFWHLLLIGFLSGGSIALVYYRTKMILMKTDVSNLIREE